MIWAPGGGPGPKLAKSPAGSTMGGQHQVVWLMTTVAQFHLSPASAKLWIPKGTIDEELWAYSLE
jgi:hypothetical protein